MTITEAWRRVRMDPRWKKKLAITAAVNLIPYVGPFIVIGYSLNYARALAWGTDGGMLPDWNAFGEHGKRGLYGFVVSLVYGLPLLLVVFALEIPMFFFIFAAAAPSHGSPAAVLPVVGVFTVLLMAVSYAYAPVTYSGLLQYLIYDRIDAAWRFREVLDRMRANGRLLVALVLRVVAIGLGTFVVTFGTVGVVVGLMILPAVGNQDLAPVGLAAIPFGYMLLFLVASALGAVANLVIYAMLGAYAREAYGLSRRAA